MEELVDGEEISAAATRPTGVSRLQEELEKQAAEDLDLLLRHPRSLAKEDKK